MKRLPKTSGIYTIINTISNNRYVGSSVNLYNRQNMHMWSLKVNRHKNPHLQASYNKYGKDAFIFETLEECNVESLIQSEQYYVNNLKPKYNVHTECVKSCLGIKRSPEYIENISKRNTGNFWSQERKDAFSKLAKERKWTPPNNIGKKHSMETINKIVESNKMSLKRVNAIKRLQKSVVSLNVFTGIFEEFESLIEASKQLNIPKGSLSYVIKYNKPYKNYLISYNNEQ